MGNSPPNAQDQNGSPLNLDVLASGFSAVLGFEVVIADSTQRRQAGMDALPTLTIDEVFKMTYPSVSDDKGNVRDGFPIFVRTLTGSTIILQVASYFTIASVKAEIEHQESIPANKQRLSFNGKKLDDDETVENAGISNGSIIFLALTLRGSGKPVVVLPKEDLAPEFNYDLSRKKDNGEKYYRGDFEYHRPYGWYRYAIKVRDAQKYGRDNTWLGPKGERTQSADGEWPVSYHGTHKKAARGIIKEGFRIGRRELHGRGVYSTPILETATKFATEFRKGLHRYKIVFQNRVNPASEHLIIIPPEQTKCNTEYWISPKQDPANNVYDIRPYGVLLRQLD